MSRKKQLAVVLMLGLSACVTKGKGRDDKRQVSTPPGPAAPADPTAPATATGINGAPLKLKGTTLLAQSLYSTLGTGMNLTNEQDDRGQRKDLFDVYSQNLGQTEGLRFGEVYPDSPSASYLLALTIIADNAARRCQEELGTGPAKTLCHCETADQAKAMMARAFPFAGFDKGDHADTVGRFADLCAKDYVAAVSSLIASVGFAVKQ